MQNEWSFKSSSALQKMHVPFAFWYAENISKICSMPVDSFPFIWWQHYQHCQLSQLWFQKAVNTRLLVSLLTLLPRKILQHCVLFVWTAWEGSLPKQIPCLVQDHVSNRREPANRIGIELPVLSPSSFEKEQCLKASFSTRQADQLIALKKHGPAPASHHLKWVP